MSEEPRIRLRAWEEADLPALMALRNDVALQAQLLATVRGSSLEQVRAWARERSAGPPGLLRVIAARKDDAALGYLQLRGQDDQPHSAQLGICLQPESQGMGFGTEALQQLLGQLRAASALCRIELRVRADNTRALRCYEALGFRRCGFMPRDVHVDGAWCDVVAMERAVRA
jgi:diamine N-acetyltransferase